MQWILFVGAAWPVSAALAALLLGRAIGLEDRKAAETPAPNFVVDGAVAYAWPGRIVPPAG
jgi:hypothetical protein